MLRTWLKSLFAPRPLVARTEHCRLYRDAGQAKCTACGSTGPAREGSPYCRIGMTLKPVNGGRTINDWVRVVETLKAATPVAPAMPATPVVQPWQGTYVEPTTAKVYDWPIPAPKFTSCGASSSTPSDGNTAA